MRRILPDGPQPSTLGMLAAKREYDLMGEQYFLGDCFECGCCTYVCPSNIPLVQQFRVAKQMLRCGRRRRNTGPPSRSVPRRIKAIGQASRQIMRHVVYSLLPICAFYVFQYGMSALASIVVVTAPAC
jgi:Na+-translocating ferredoxin:NAD+ oxidoreductase RnfC subunit